MRWKFLSSIAKDLKIRLEKALKINTRGNYSILSLEWTEWPSRSFLLCKLTALWSSAVEFELQTFYLDINIAFSSLYR